jgi:hypothetical protein
VSVGVVHAVHGAELEAGSVFAELKMKTETTSLHRPEFGLRHQR